MKRFDELLKKGLENYKKPITERKSLNKRRIISPRPSDSSKSPKDLIPSPSVKATELFLKTIRIRSSDNKYNQFMKLLLQDPAELKEWNTFNEEKRNKLVEKIFPLQSEVLICNSYQNIYGSICGVLTAYLKGTFKLSDEEESALYFEGTDDELGEQYYFEERKITSGESQSDCGFNALNVTRSQFVEILLAQKDDILSRDMLKSEIKSAIEDNQINIPPSLRSYEWKKLYDYRTGVERELADKKISLEKSFNIDAKDLTALHKALVEKQLQESIDELELLQKKLKDAEEELETYYTSLDTYITYVQWFEKNGWLGYKSAELYAKATQKGICIWRKSDNKPRKLSIGMVQRGPGSEVIHLLHTDKFSHFNLLSPIQVAPDKVKESYDVRDLKKIAELNTKIQKIIISQKKNAECEIEDFIKFYCSMDEERRTEINFKTWEESFIDIFKEHVGHQFMLSFPRVWEAFDKSDFYIKNVESIDSLSKLVKRESEEFAIAAEVNNADYAAEMTQLDEKNKLISEANQRKKLPLLTKIWKVNDNGNSGIPYSLREEIKETELHLLVGQVNPHYVEESTGNNLVHLSVLYDNNNMFKYLTAHCKVDAELRNKKGLSAWELLEQKEERVKEFMNSDQLQLSLRGNNSLGNLLTSSKPVADAEVLLGGLMSVLSAYQQQWIQRRDHRKAISQQRSFLDTIKWALLSLAELWEESKIFKKRGDEVEHYMEIVNSAIKEIPADFRSELKGVLDEADWGPFAGSQLHSMVKQCVDEIERDTSTYRLLLNSAPLAQQKMNQLAEDHARELREHDKRFEEVMQAQQVKIEEQKNELQAQKEHFEKKLETQAQEIGDLKAMVADLAKQVRDSKKEEGSSLRFNR